MKKVLEARPYEKETGKTDQVYQTSLKRVCDAILKGDDLVEALQKSMEDFNRIEMDGLGTKPLIGIVGEIFVRLNRFANENVIRKIEQFGGEAWIAPLTEWILYVNTIAKKRSLKNRSFSNLLKVFLTDYYQKKDEHHLENVFKGQLKHFGEPPTRSIFRNAKPYVDASFEGEAILSVGKTIDFARRERAGLSISCRLPACPGQL